jgi:hypothetical protein
MEGFKECVAQAWSREVPTSYNSLATLHIKLIQTAKAMKNWSKKILSYQSCCCHLQRDNC